MNTKNQIRPASKIRNIAIIAHIDHGKTTLLDALLKQTDMLKGQEASTDRVMDSFELEQERGITIFAKHTSLFYGDYKINVIDTPGHADFSGEVERVLGMVSSVLLLVDAQEGPMPQTRFVLSKALKMGLCPIVVLNKIDRPNANPANALNKTFDLFVELGANDKQLDFHFCYASGLSGFAMRELTDPRENMKPLFDMVIECVEAPSGLIENPFLLQATSLTYNDFFGRGATGRILQGKLTKGESITMIDKTGVKKVGKISRIEGHEGLRKIELDVAGAGDIITLFGFENAMIGDTFCDSAHPEQLPPIDLEEPTLSIEISVNTSPLVGQDGKLVTMNKIKERLFHEKRANISLGIEEIPGREDAITVKGRGELQLSVLIETMRREGFECTISKPKVLTKMIEGTLCEPYEIAYVEVPEQFSGSVIEELSRRKGEMLHLETNEHHITSMQFVIPTRCLMGYRGDFLTLTRGDGIMNTSFAEFKPMKGDFPGRNRGVLIANAAGKITPYALFNLQDRGQFFVTTGTEVYEGMIVGIHCRDNDLNVNITREKHLSNVRASGKDENMIIAPPRKMGLEQAIEFIDDDELIEVTPHHIRMRKAKLKESDRKRN